MTLAGSVARLGNIAGWPTVTLRSVVARADRYGKPGLPLLGVNLHEGVRLRGEDDGRPAASEDLRGYKVVEPGDVIMNRLGKPHGSIGVSPWEGITSPAYWVLIVDRNVAVPRFIHYLLRSRHMISEYERLGKYMPPNQFDIGWNDFRSIVLPLPSVTEQQRISDLLDDETMQMDRLSSVRARQYTALDARELSLIMEAFQDPGTNARRPAPWKWLPTVPCEWPVGPVSAYFASELGKMLNPDRAAAGNQAPYLRNANVHWYEISTNDLATMAFEPGELHRYSVRAGDLLVCEGGAGVAEAAVWDGRIERCYFQKSLHRVRSVRDVPVEWLMYWLRLAKAVGQFDAEGNLSTIPHLTGEQLRAMRLPIPPDVDSRVRSLKSQIGALSVTRAKLRRADELLAERRQALITAAVTGQFDVTTARGADLS